MGDVSGNSPEIIIDSILSVISIHKAIIFDLRNNGGGFGEYGEPFANAFSEGENFVNTSQVRNGPNYDNYDDAISYYTADDNINQYLKPVVVLTDAFTVSAAESILLYLKTNSHVTHIGDRTAGAFSTASTFQFLPNGWAYKYPIEASFDADGVSLDNTGILPDIPSKNTPENISNDLDIVLEDAIEYLD